MIAIIWYPFFSLYRAFASGLTFGDVVLIIASIFLIFEKKGAISMRFSIASWYMVFYLYCVILLFILSLMSRIIIPSLVIKRYIKLGMFIVILVFLCPGSLEYSFYKNTYKRIAFIVMLGLVVQYVSYFAGFGYIELKIPYLSYDNESMNMFDITASRSSLFRPSSIFIEPATCSYFLVQYLILVLFDKSDERRLSRGFVISLFLLLSVSSTALILITFVWLIFIIDLISTKNYGFSRKILIFILVGFGFSILGSILISVDEISYALYRMIFSIDKSLATSVWGRLEAGSEYLLNNGWVERVFGMGLGNYPKTNTYTSGLYFSLYGAGYIGTTLLLIWAVNALRFTEVSGKSMALVFMLLNLSSPLLYSGMMISMNSIVLMSNRKHYINRQAMPKLNTIRVKI
ncbi:MAG: hypothetical protein EOM50_10515 [Erysipelotrichia bacterium]|nr:hypothetical protein [Erysipelotrichia bacterium]